MTERQRDDTATARDLLQSLNDEAATARAMWIAFNTILFFLAVTTMGITHVDMLFGKELKLPIVDIGIPLHAFVVIAPVFIVVMMIAVLLEHTTLARKAHAFNDADPGQLRELASGYFFIQSIVAPQGNLLVRWSHVLISALTLTFAPLLTLLFMQFQLLPLQSNYITNWHRGIVFLSCVVAFAFWLAHRHPNLTVLKSFRALFGKGSWSRQNFWKPPFWDRCRLFAQGATLLIMVLISVFVGVGAQERSRFFDAAHWANVVSGKKLFGPESNRSLDNQSSFFYQSLVVRDFNPEDYEALKTVPRRFRKRNFVEMDARGANLSASDFAGSNLAGANFSWAILVQSKFDSVNLPDARFVSANLISSRFACFEDKKWIEPPPKLSVGASLAVVTTLDFLKEEEASRSYCNNMQRADFRTQHLGYSVFESADASRANFDSANLAALKFDGSLDGANLTFSTLIGADLAGSCQTCSFANANLIGARLDFNLFFDVNMQDTWRFGVEFAHFRNRDPRSLDQFEVPDLRNSSYEIDLGKEVLLKMLTCDNKDGCSIQFLDGGHVERIKKLKSFLVDESKFDNSTSGQALNEVRLNVASSEIYGNWRYQEKLTKKLVELFVRSKGRIFACPSRFDCGQKRNIDDDAYTIPWKSRDGWGDWITGDSWSLSDDRIRPDDDAYRRRNNVPRINSHLYALLIGDACKAENIPCPTMIAPAPEKAGER